MTAKSGKKIKFQKVFFDRGDGARYPVEIMCKEDVPFPTGIYNVLPSSFEAGRFGSIEVRFDIEPQAQTKPQPQPVKAAS